MAAGATYVPIATTTLGSAAASYTFTSIPQTYTDLVLVTTVNTSTSTGINIQFNGDTGTNYSCTRMYSGPSSDKIANTTNSLYSWTANNNSSYQFHIMNYSNTNVYKTFLGRMTDINNNTGAYVSLWRNTSAITSLNFFGSSNFTAGSTFTLYGVAASDNSVTPKATGGTITADVGYIYHTFTSSGTFTPSQALTADVLVVAGGGGGGSIGGGGGAGGVVYNASQSLTSGTGYTCTVGSGGSHSTIGGNSAFTGLTTAVGGGRGGDVNTNNAGTGGSGGGGGRSSTAGTLAGGSATSGQGNAGGTGNQITGFPSGGGGGAGSVGTNGAVNQSGAGGAGLNTYSSWLSTTGFGSSGYIAGGGGGMGDGGALIQGAGGLGGGGVGEQGTTPAGNGLANSGSGGGGWTSYSTGIGGSGLIIVRYAN